MASGHNDDRRRLMVLSAGNGKEPDAWKSFPDSNKVCDGHDPARAWMAAKIQAAYPKAWPETVRALIVHSAEWTDAMKRAFLANESKSAYYRLTKVCGYGVPNLERAISCAANSLSLIAEAEIQPFG